MMNCEVCRRLHHPKKLPFLCPVDGRNRLYEPRLAHAKALIENEAVEQHINTALSKSSLSSSAHATARSARFRHIRSLETQAADRTSQMISQADRLRAEIEVAKEDIGRRQNNISRRKADLSEAINGTESRRDKQLEDTETAIQQTRSEWNRNSSLLAQNRGFLSLKVARLYGLRRNKKGNKYEIGRVELIGIPDMITASPEAVSASLAHIVHLLTLVSHYLSLRLPAEITPPHGNYPRPTVLSLASSYRHGDVPFPDSVAVTPLTIPTDHIPKQMPRPRPLFLDRPLLTLAKEDPLAYSLFIEGVVLLAYNIAWACCTQGVQIGDKSSNEDVCNMGRNLYNLLIGQQVGNNATACLLQGEPNNNHVDSPFDPSRPMMGRYSHGTAHTFLGSYEGNEFMRNFKLPNPVKLADRLKKKLISDADGLDWDMLEDEAWAPDEPMEEGVQGKAKRLGQADRHLFGVESVMSTSTAVSTLDSTIGNVAHRSVDELCRLGAHENGKVPGPSGWTKIKSK